MAGDFYAFEEFVTSAKINSHADGNATGNAANANRTLKAAGAFDNGDLLAAENYTTAAGVNGTVNSDEALGLTTAVSLNTTDQWTDPSNTTYTLGGNDLAPGDTTHDPDSFTNASNLFDGDIQNPSYAERVVGGTSGNGSIGKTFAAEFIDFVLVGAQINRFNSNSMNTGTVKLQSFDGAVWNDETTLVNASGQRTGIVYGFYRLGKTVQGLRIRFDYSDDASLGCTFRAYSLEYGESLRTTAVFNTNLYECNGGAGSYTNSKVLCDTNTITLDGTETAICVYSDQNLQANTSIDVDISDGTNTLSNQPLNSLLAISSFTSGTLELTFNLNTTNVNNTPTQSGWGVLIFR